MTNDLVKFKRTFRRVLNIIMCLDHVQLTIVLQWLHNKGYAQDE